MADRYWVGGSGTWNTTSTTNWSVSSGGPSGASVPTAADNVIFNSATTYTVTMTGALACLSFTVSAGTVTFAQGTTPTLAISGSISVTSSTVWTMTGAITFNSTTTQTITTNNISISSSIVLNGVGGSWTLGSAARFTGVTLTNGTFSLSSYTCTTTIFASSNANTRVIDFGTGNITLIGTGTVWNTGTVTGLSTSGTQLVNVNNNTATATTVSPGSLSETNSISFNFTSGTYALSLSAGSYRSLNFTGFSGTLNNATRTLYGSLTISTGMTLTGGTSSQNFIGTSGIQYITSNGKTLDFSIILNGLNGTREFVDALTLTAARELRIQDGTVNFNDKTITCGFCTDANGTPTRIWNFGTTGNVTVIGTTGTIFSLGAGGGGPGTLTYTGTPTINVNSTAGVGVLIGINTTSFFTELNALTFNFTSGSYTLNPFYGLTALNINYTGFSGVLNRNSTCYGNLTYSSSMSFTQKTVTFRSTKTTNTITSNGVVVDDAMTFNGVGGKWEFQDNLTMGSTRSLTQTNGTIDLNGKVITVGASYATASGTKNLTFNGGTLICPNSTTTAFNNAQPTNFTTTAGTGTGKISMTSASAKSFVGGGSTYNCTLSNDGAGDLTITGNNTFTTLANGVQPTTFKFTSGTTTNLTNWNISGTSGNLVTIVSTATSQHTLSKSSGSVSTDYLSISYSNATGGAVWEPGVNSINGGNNSGWLFPGGSGNFFLLM